MITNTLPAIVKAGILALSCAVILVSCTTESAEIDEPVLNMGDPKNTSSQGSRCFEIFTFVNQGEDETATYEEIKWEFKNNGTLIVRSQSQVWPGTYNIGIMDGVQRLTMVLQDTFPPMITVLSGIWTVLDLNPDNPQFIRNEDSPNPDMLEFASSECSFISPELETLNSFLRDSLFVITSFLQNDVDFTSAFNNVTFDFGQNNKVTAQRNEQQKVGLWVTSQPTGSILHFEIQFNNASLPLSALNATWDVVEVTEDSILLEYLDGPPDTGSYYMITMER